MKTLTTTIEMQATPDEIWDALVDFPAHERWNPFFASIHGSPEVGQRLTVTTSSAHGRAMTFRPVVLDVEPARLLRWRGRFLAPGLFTGTHEFRLDAGPDGRTTLTHSETFGGVLVPFLGSALRDTEEGFVAFNRALADEVAHRRSLLTRP